MNEVSIIINGVRYDSIPSEHPRSCLGCDLLNRRNCKFAMVCKENDTIFKKSDKKFEV